jgi:hypothetical protein
MWTSMRAMLMDVVDFFLVCLLSRLLEPLVYVCLEVFPPTSVPFTFITPHTALCLISRTH